ncbi:Mediator of RNA polymerase II transcription subunit 33A [Abeliophyllum distichum]|uniref:Mediator of RNA polymerase II transcription subunit 33A n=1 Tax=Abeliophyllum distichum TaxID=126358 RepID=A0ABD1RA31_9LAMI
MGSQRETQMQRSELERMVAMTVKTFPVGNETPLVWAMELAKCVEGMGGGLPSTDLAEVVVAQLCFSNNNPSMWKFLHQAISCGLLYPLHVLSLLTSRIIPHCRSQPEAYRLYLELLSIHSVSFIPLGMDASKEKIAKSIDVALQLSKTYGFPVFELGHAMVLCFFSIIVHLIDSAFDDLGLQMGSKVGACEVTKSEDTQKMDIDFRGNQVHKTNEFHEQIRRTNSSMCLEVLTKLTDNKRAVGLLRLVHLNMPEKFNGLLRKIEFLEAHSLSPNLKHLSPLLSKLSTNIHRSLVLECQLSKHQLIGALMDNGSCKLASPRHSVADRFNCWVAFDICMEDAMDGKQFPVTSAIDILKETINTLQVFNGASWQETFLALWLSALRLVQRERDPLEGPIPHLEARLCILLSIVPLAIARVFEDNSTLNCSSLQEGMVPMHLKPGCERGKSGLGLTSRRQGLISSLQVLVQYHTLLCPPASVVDASNNAAAKAKSFISRAKNVKDGIDVGDYSEAFVKEGGDLRHLIVEACIARNLIDTSVYFWPGYVPASVSVSHSSPCERSPWSAFMDGAPLTDNLVTTLITSPASSLAEIEKLYHIALSGKEDEKLASAKILCGSSLSRGWNIQEHVIHYVLKLLCPPVPLSHLIEYMPMLSAVLYSSTTVDIVHILSLHGMVPEVAAALMPLCEVFGSLEPTSSHKLRAYNESSKYMVFSLAFLFLMRLWKFYRPPVEHCITGRGGAIGSELTLEYLLLLRNSRIQFSSDDSQGERMGRVNVRRPISDGPIYIDSYPKLRAWYCQNRSCIASTLSGLRSGNPIHQVANKILNMIYGRLTRSGTSSDNSSTPSCITTSGSPVTSAQDAGQIPLLPAWDILEAVPFVLEAILTACAHGRLSSRDLTTGLRDLVDFLPASLATIITYFSAEVTRGLWKPVPMNGTDWPSPAANLMSVESEMKEILAAAGVNVPTSSSGVSPPMLPLPMAALVSLTITFKLDKSLEYIHAVAGPALENCASSCAWPSMPIIGSLWVQKVLRWHDFIIVSCSRSVFRQNGEAVSQLLRSCFTSFLGSLHPSSSSLLTGKGVNSLLGNFISARGLKPPVAPGFLYLRSCRTIRHIQHVNNVIVVLVAEFSRNSAMKWASAGSPRLKSGQPSLAVAASRAKEVAALGASLLCVAGGFHLVQELYQETVPTWLLSAGKGKSGEVSAVCQILEGYAMAYLLVLSGAFVWGVGAKRPSQGLSRRSRIIGTHMDFIAGVLSGNILLECDPITWKAYVSCLVGLTVSFAPIWIQEVKPETLRILANGLRGWHECELALTLLERGGTATMGSVAEMLLNSGLND